MASAEGSSFLSVAATFVKDVCDMAEKNLCARLAIASCIDLSYPRPVPAKSKERCISAGDSTAWNRIVPETCASYSGRARFNPRNPSLPSLDCGEYLPRRVVIWQGTARPKISFAICRIGDATWVLSELKQTKGEP